MDTEATKTADVGENISTSSDSYTESDDAQDDNYAQFRLLSADDNIEEYCRLLGGLTQTTCLSCSKFMAILTADSNKLIYVVSVNRDLHDPVLRPGEMIATGSLLIEHKFTRAGAIAGHIEDIVVSPKYQGQGWGERLVRHLIAVAEMKGCYKVILTCKESLVPFYRRCGFDQQQVSMAKYL